LPVVLRSSRERCDSAESREIEDELATLQAPVDFDKRTWITIFCAGIEKATLDSYLMDGVIIVDRHPQARIYSQRPIGPGPDELK